MIRRKMDVAVFAIFIESKVFLILVFAIPYHSKICVDL
jgi:hypothetical protein